METRKIVNGAEETIKTIKESLEVNFSVTVWTDGWTEEQKINESRFLTENGVVHYWDENIDAFLCFRSTEDLIHFYETVLGVELNAD